MRELRRIAIINRGEPAMRLIHAVREYNRENGTAIETIALYTDPDRRAMFVREADHAVALGPALVADGQGKRRSAYLDYDRLQAAMLDKGADAAWVGWGFVAEHAEFAERCRSIGVTFIGPSPEAMRRLGDKITSKLLAEQARVPVSAWSGGPVATIEEAHHHAARLGYPLMVKATAGGGGRGIRQVMSEAELAPAFDSARAEAAAAFGDATVFLERRVRGARHIEVQILGDEHGTTWAVGVRDCSIQRRHQKVLEEAPSPALSPAEDRELREASARLAREAGYHGAGTVEYLFDPETHGVFFMEVNARLQVEHPVTECTTGLDLVKLQIHIARGGRLEGEAPPAVGHAIEVRVCAEDPDKGFQPSPGRIDLLRLPTGPGLRVDTGVAEGDEVPPEFDSMIAKLIAYGKDRDEALARLRRALVGSAIVIRGGTSNKAFLLALLDRPEVRSGAFDTTWLDGLAARGEHVSRRHADVALLMAAVSEYEAELDARLARFLESATRGRPALAGEAGFSCELLYRGNRYRFGVSRVGASDYRVSPLGADGGEGEGITVSVDELGRFERRVLCCGERHRVLSVVHGADHLVEVDGVPHHVARDPGGVVRAAIPAVVISLAVKPGDRVEAGARLATLEAMKMEVPVTAPLAGRVRAVLVAPNTQVPAGTPLVQLEPLDDEGDGAATASERVTFTPPHHPAAQASDKARFLGTAAELRHLFLGYDVTGPDARRLSERWKELCHTVAADPSLRPVQDELLRMFTDLNTLFRRQRDPGGGASETRSSQEYLVHYLRELEAKGAGLPASFLDKLDRALAWYGVASRDNTARLHEALLRIYKAHDRITEQVSAVSSILERRLSQGAPPAEDELHALIDRIRGISAGRFPALMDLATEVHHTHFARPLFERSRAETYARVDDHLLRLRDPNLPADERSALVTWVVDCAQPLATRFARRAAIADRVDTENLLEILTRRFYRIRPLEYVSMFKRGEQIIATGEYVHEGRRCRIFTAFASWQGLTETLGRLAGPVGDTPADRDVVADLYVWDGAPHDDPDHAVEELRATLKAAPLTRTLRRVAVTVTGTTPQVAGGHDLYFTFRPSPPSEGGGYTEQRQYRGIHPMMGKRLHIWRLENFDLERLPSAQDVYLYHGRARANPKDERFFVMAEVRDVTPVRDAAGRVIELPHLERMLSEALASIRLAQARRGGDRLEWNRVLLYVWPPLVMTRDELSELARRMAPQTEGLGLEQVMVRARLSIDGDAGNLRDTLMRLSSAGARGLRIVFEDPTERPLLPLAAYEQKVVQLRRRGLTYPYEIVRLLTPREGGGKSEMPLGSFVEHDLDAATGRLVPVERARGGNQANVVVGVIRNVSERHPEGMARVIVLGDPSKEMGSLAEPECTRIEAAIALATEMGVPLEWFALSAGAKISMKSGTENMDWVARVLRRLIHFTQAGGEVNVVVCGINVGAQPYWNAEATMLMHTRGILIMMPESAMVLTGKQALDYSGSVSAEDNIGIGGYDRIMGINGQAQYFARDLSDACRVLMQHYEYTYVVPGERFPRRSPTTDPLDRDVRSAPHGGEGDGAFATIGEVFSEEKNPGRKRPFEIRKVMAAVCDRDHAPIERWHDWRGAETGVVWDGTLGGWPVCLVGIESRSVQRLGFVPADGPDGWSAGTLFPQSSKKVARAINAASGNRPLVVLANLSGFDGSPESMRKLQLEYGAEIGRAVVNFDGPIVFCVVSRYHGGAFVVFSRTLNPDLEASALEGAHASVIGGAPAAAVVFSREVDTRTQADPRVRAADEKLRAAGGGPDKARLRVELTRAITAARAEKLGEVADEFDTVHSVERALRVGSLDRIIPVIGLRPYLIDAVERGMRRVLERRG